MKGRTEKKLAPELLPLKANNLEIQWRKSKTFDEPEKFFIIFPRNQESVANIDLFYYRSSRICSAIFYNASRLSFMKKDVLHEYLWKSSQSCESTFNIRDGNNLSVNLEDTFYIIVNTRGSLQTILFNVVERQATAVILVCD